MSTVRRWYIYLVSAISLQAVTWATIALSRNLLISQLDQPLAAIAFQISMILIGLPIFLAHWLWGQRLAKKSTEERGATLRRVYLYGMLAAFLGPFAANVYSLIGALLRTDPAMDEQLYRPYSLTYGGAIVYHLLALFILGVLWFYHRRVVADAAQTAPETGGSATARRLYILGFNTAGLTMTALASIKLLRWIMLQVGSNVVSSSLLDVSLTTEVARLIVGVPLWLIFWRWAQRLFAEPSTVPSGNREERESALRKLYLYSTVFVGVLSVVINSTGILASMFRRILGLLPEGDIRAPLPIIIVMGIVWAYHTLVLRQDAEYHQTEKGQESSRQAGVRRLYLYLVAAIGLFAMLVGLSGDVSVTLRALDTSFGSGLKEELAWFTASIIAGLLVWVFPWRRAQNRAAVPGSDGADARRSTIRKIYVYLFLFIATMTVLSGAVFIVYKLFSWLLGLDAPTLNELGHAIAFSLIAVCVWLYHGFILRSDHRLLEQEQVDRLQDLHIAIVDVGDGHLGYALANALKQETPLLDLEPILLPPPSHSDEEITTRLSQAKLIIGPWTIAIPSEAEGTPSHTISQIITNSPARKLLLPTRSQGWEWVGVDYWDTESLTRQAVHAVKQITKGEDVKPVRPLGAGAIVGIVIGVLFLLILMVIPILSILEGF